MPNEKPILFKPEMVRATLDDRKTKTRRTSGLDKVNENPSEWEFEGRILCSAEKKDIGKYSFTEKDGDGFIYLKCPYGEVGGRLWVKEAWWHHKSDYLEQAAFEGRTITKLDGVGCEPNINAEFHPSDYPWVWKKKSSRYMPRWASRLTLEITDIRVERVQDITEEDAMAEGVTVHLDAVMAGAVAQDSPARLEFLDLWNSIHKNDGKHWDANPWVWVIAFKKI